MGAREVKAAVPPVFSWSAGDRSCCPLPAGDKPSLDRAAGALTKTALLNKTDVGGRADTWAGGSGQAPAVKVPLKPGLKAGAYALVWRFLSDDGHVVTGQSVFHVQ